MFPVGKQNWKKMFENKIDLFSLWHPPATHECPQKKSAQPVQPFGGYTQHICIHICVCLVLLYRSYSENIVWSGHPYLWNSFPPRSPGFEFKNWNTVQISSQRYAILEQNVKRYAERNSRRNFMWPLIIILTPSEHHWRKYSRFS